MGLRAEEEGGSEGRPVIGRIGVEAWGTGVHYPPRKWADFPLVSAGGKPQPTGGGWGGGMWAGGPRTLGGVPPPPPRPRWTRVEQETRDAAPGHMGGR